MAQSSSKGVGEARQGGTASIHQCRVAMQSSKAERLLACQAHNQPKNALSLHPLCGWFFSRRFRDCPQSGSGNTSSGGFGGWQVQGLPPIPHRNPSREWFCVFAGCLSDRVLLAHGLDFHPSSHLLATYPFLSASHPPTLWAFLNV